MAKRSSGGGLWLVLGAFVLIATVPREAWIGLVVLGGICFVVYFVIKHLNSKPASSATVDGDQREPTLAELAGRPQTDSNIRPTLQAPKVRSELNSQARAAAHSRPSPPAQADEFFAAPEVAGKAVSSYAIPKAPSGFGDGRWVPPGQNIEVAGVELPGGMIYVGGRLKALSGTTDPCLISGQLNAARVGDYRSRQMGYWPSYSDASPNERRAYLNWLSEVTSSPR